MNKYRPLWVRSLAICAVVVMLMLCGSIWVWMELPADARLPVHFGMDGQVNRYGSKAEALLLMPGVVAFLVLIIALLPVIEPRQKHLQQSMPAVLTIMVGVVVMMAVVHGAMLALAQGHAVNIGRLVCGVIGLLWVLIGNLLGKLRSNFFVGVRTPWTLSSELAWDKTHRLAGKLFVGVGLLSVLSALLANEWLMVGVLVFGTLTAVLVTVVYSFWIWRQDKQVGQARASGASSHGDD